MNYEENRLKSFTNWPSWVPVEPLRIAKAGFYYMGRGAEVVCFSCGSKIETWDYGDQVMARHTYLKPTCLFVLDSRASGNIPLELGLPCPPLDSWTPNRTNTLRNSDNENIEYGLSEGYGYGVIEDDVMHRNDALRLLSFVNWPINFVSREVVVSAGLYHVGEGRVRCAWCGGELGEAWRQGDDPLEIHRQRHPSCQNAAMLANVRAFNEVVSAMPRADTPPLPSINHRPIEGESSQKTEGAVHNDRVLSGGPTWQALGLVSGASGARNPERASMSSRLGTYTLWPHRTQGPTTLAEAGFYYTGMEDRVCCFYCGGGLGKWETGDVPWTEHAHWFPECGFVLLVKGRDFIEKCKVKNNARRSCSANTAPSSRRMRIKITFPVSETQVEELMESPHALSALSTGLDVARVRRAIVRRLKATGLPFNSSEALIDTVLDDQLNEESWSTSTSRNMMINQDLAERFRGFNPSIIPMSDERAELAISEEPLVNASPPEPVVTNNDIAEPEAEPPVAVTSDNGEVSPEKEVLVQMKQISLEEENRQLKEARLCKVCMDSEVSVVLLPCGHLVSCAGCGASLAACPLCRAAVKALVRAYLA